MDDLKKSQSCYAYDLFRNETPRAATDVDKKFAFIGLMLRLGF